MNLRKLRGGLVIGLLAASFTARYTFADDDDDISGPATGDTHYGMLGLLDHRSKYGHDWFPEPFRVDDSDVGNEARFDWEHDEGRHAVSNTVQLQAEKSFGLVTFEIQAPYIIDATSRGDGNDGEPDESGGTGFGNISLSGRVPIWQSVSPSGLFDNTVGAELEVGAAPNSSAGKNTEIAPGIFNDLRLGDHFSIQSLFNISWLLGSEPQGGTRAFGYALAFGYSIEDEEFSLSNIERITPSVELLGETRLDGDSAGHNSLTGTVGFRADLRSIGGIQPQIGLAYVFPIDQGGREELRWGVITSVVVEY